MDHSNLGELPEGQWKDGKQPYVAPAIVWEEDYRPTALGVSCVLQPGNPPCSVLATG